LNCNASIKIFLHCGTHEFTSPPGLCMPASVEWVHFMDHHIVPWHQLPLFCPILT
jgi:hypothetical protein